MIELPPELGTARLSMPSVVRRGQATEVRLLIQHPMETGFRRDADGRTIPQNVIVEVVAYWGDVKVFRAELGSGVAANPYLAFFVVPTQNGMLRIEWIDTAGVRGRVVRLIAVE